MGHPDRRLAPSSPLELRTIPGDATPPVRPPAVDRVVFAALGWALQSGVPHSVDACRVRAAATVLRQPRFADGESRAGEITGGIVAGRRCDGRAVRGRPTRADVAIDASESASRAGARS